MGGPTRNTPIVRAGCDKNCLAGVGLHQTIRLSIASNGCASRN
jgi:hypothetical protein